jgi:tetratricopeptide (TPR) repeat protein
MANWPRPKNLILSRIKAARLAAARARHKPSDKKRTAWEVAELYWNRFTTLAINGGAILAAGFVLYILWESITQKVISIAPISVPKELADDGYTPDVAAERLKDALNEFVTRAHSVKGGPDVARQADLPSIVVPSTSLSTDALAAQIRRFLRIENRSNVSGEITRVDKKLWLRLRMNGRDLYTSPVGVDPKIPDDLFGGAAQKIFEETDPYILGTALIDSDPNKGLEIARRIISGRPESDSEVPWAHTLMGRILYAQGKADEATIEFRKATELDPLTAMHHNNLGITLIDQGKIEEAVTELLTAVKLDSRLALPHYNLGNILSDQHKTDEAIAEYKKAIELDPRYAYPHNGLGIILSDQHKTDEAIAEYKKAIELDPRFASPHNGLGIILSDQHKTDEAIAEYKKAIELDPRYAYLHNRLGNILSDQHKTDEAIAEYKKAIELDPRNFNAHGNLGIALRSQGKTDEAIAEYRKAIELDPLSVIAHRNLSDALRKQGKNKAADAELKKAHDLEQKH